MAIEFRVIRMLLYLTIVLSLIGGEVQAVENKAAAVREAVEQSTLPTDVQLVKFAPNNSSHAIVAVGTSQYRIILLCIEGENTLVHRLHEDDSQLSVLQLDKTSFKFLLQSPVFFDQCLAEDKAFLHGYSFTTKYYGDVCYLWSNMIDALRANRPVIQANQFGATCQPGSTVLQQVITGETCAVQTNQTIRIIDVFTSNLLREFTIDEFTDNMQLIGYTEGSLLYAISSKYKAVELPQPDKTKDDAVTDIPTQIKMDTGCRYAKLFCVEMPAKTFQEIHPLATDAIVSFSVASPSSKGLLWWEYYPSDKQPNGIWILRRQERENDPVIITAIRNIGETYYHWNGKVWAKSISIADQLLPTVSLATNGEYSVIGILGELFLLMPEIERTRQQQLLDRQHYWTNRDDPDEPRTAYEMITLGY